MYSGINTRDNEPEYNTISCTECEGSGYTILYTNHDDTHEEIEVKETCTACQGEGEITEG